MFQEQSSNQAAITAVDLVKTYPGPVTALDGMSFSCGPGTVYGLLGPNGAGKSTTVKLLTTLISPNSGSAFVGGVDVVEHPQKVRRLIGVVGQRVAVDPEATGRENLLLEGRLHGLDGARLTQRANELLAHFDLADSADRLARTYSGGMKRKLDVAMGLIHRPRVLFLDEPTTGLDPEARAGLWQEIGQLSKDEGMTILLTTHYLEEADRLADQVAIVDRGRIVVEGTPEALKSELRGDALHIELHEIDHAKRALGLVQSLDGVREPVSDGRSLRIRADSGESAVPVVLSTLEAAGIGVAAVTVSRPSLEDVYLRHTGRAYQHQNGEVLS
jgi:ABC-2 type transport system ATP-binding protein